MIQSNVSLDKNAEKMSGLTSSVNFLLNLLRKTKFMCIQICSLYAFSYLLLFRRVCCVNFVDLFFFFLTCCRLAVRTLKKFMQLRISSITKLRTCSYGRKLLNLHLRTWGCGLRKLKFVGGVADCGLKTKTCGAQNCSQEWNTKLSLTKVSSHRALKQQRSLIVFYSSTLHQKIENKEICGEKQ